MIGTRLVAALASKGLEVIRVGRLKEADIQLDLLEGFKKPILKDMRADVIFHCAAAFAKDSPEGIRQNYQVNASGCLWVLEFAEILECRTIVYAGTVFSEEKSDPKAFTYYGFSKAQGEEVLKWGLERIGGRFCSLRFSQIYDTNGLCVHHQSWLVRVVAYTARGLNINMPPSNGVRNFLHVDDVANFMICAARSPVNGTINVVHPESMTYHDIASIAYRIFGKGGQVLINPNKQPFRPFNFPDGNRALQLLGGPPRICLEEGIKRIRDHKTWSSFGPLDITSWVIHCLTTPKLPYCHSCRRNHWSGYCEISASKSVSSPCGGDRS